MRRSMQMHVYKHLDPDPLALARHAWRPSKARNAPCLAARRRARTSHPIIFHIGGSAAKPHVRSQVPALRKMGMGLHPRTLPLQERVATKKAWPRPIHPSSSLGFAPRPPVPPVSAHWLLGREATLWVWRSKVQAGTVAGAGCMSM